MAASADEICSMAMEILGHTGFTTFASTQDRHHKAAERLWPTVRDRVLARAAWNSCIKRVNLTVPDPVAPIFDYANRFPLPADWLRTLSVGSGNWNPEYRIEGGFILVGADAVTIRYVFRNVVASTYEASLTDLLVQAMVARMAMTVTQSVNRADMEAQAYMGMLNTATAIDGVEDDGPTLGYNSPLLDCRYE